MNEKKYVGSGRQVKNYDLINFTIAEDKTKEVVIKVDKVEQADQAAGGFIRKYAEAQVEK